MSIKAKVTTQNTINAQVNPDNKIIPKQVSSGGGGAALTDGDGITDITEDKVVVDGNHPLAGLTLHFDCTVIGVRPATDEEISHGHVHE